jgi:predicted membrane protein
MQDVVSLALVGAAVSVLVQFIKNSVGTSRAFTVTVVIVLSLIAGTVYTFFRNTAIWEAGLQVLLYANAVYGFIISYFESIEPKV